MAGMDAAALVMCSLIQVNTQTPHVPVGTDSAAPALATGKQVNTETPHTLVGLCSADLQAAVAATR